MIHLSIREIYTPRKLPALKCQVKLGYAQEIGTEGTHIYGNIVTPDLYFRKYWYPHTNYYSKIGCPLVNMGIPSNTRGVNQFATDRALGEE